MSDGDHKPRKFPHPGAGRSRAAIHPKGRQLDADAHGDVLALLGDRARQRDLLIEYLHLIQDKYRCLAPDHLVALAHEMRLSLAEVYETATFYAHFDVLKDDEAAPPDITIRVCDGIACEMAGAEALIDGLAGKMDDSVRIKRAPCMGGCDCAPVAEIGQNQLPHASVETIAKAVAAGSVGPVIPDYCDFDAYVASGGYSLLRDCLSGKHGPDDIMDALDASGMRGLGGAGFPTGRKWRIVRDQPAPRMFAINADEGEPGTFKDRHFLETDPHRMLEGALIAAWAVGTDTTYLYVRDEYAAILHILKKEIARLVAEGLVAADALRLRRGAGAYICGEESAMLESIEGKRGLPRHKPPYPAEIGLFGLPTLINNVETLHWVRDIVEKGPDWFSGHGRNGRSGLRTFSVSGRVREPGVKIAHAGITVRELIDEYCGGMEEGHTLKGYLPGGASGGILPAAMDNIPLDFGTLEEHGCLIGSAAVVVLSEHDSPADAALNLMRFFEDESCGQCTPCRSGCEKAVQLMETANWNQDLLNDLSAVMIDASICGLGQAAPNGLKSVFRFFPDDVPGPG